MAYCTRSDVKTYLGIASTDTGKDDTIDLLIPDAQAFIDEYCGMSFEAAALTEYHDGGSNKIFLNRFPVDKTQTIQVWDDWQRVYGSDTFIDSADYYVDENTGVIKFDYPVGGSPGAVKVSYTGGEANNVAKQACIELVARMVKEGPVGGLSVGSKAIPGGGSVSFAISELSPQTKGKLDLLVKPVAIQ